MVLLVFLLWFWGIVVVSVHFALTVIVYRDAIKYKDLLYIFRRFYGLLYLFIADTQVCLFTGL